MNELKKNFPEGIDYSVVYDPTIFVRHSIEAVVHTLFEAILLVVIVVILFLQTWRRLDHSAGGSPGLAGGHVCRDAGAGLSINALSLFGLVLAIASSWTTPSLWSKTSSETSRSGCSPSRLPNER